MLVALASILSCVHETVSCHVIISPGLEQMANITILDQMSTGDVIDRSVRLYRRNFTPLVLIVSVPTLIGYFASVTFLIGYLELIGNVENPTSSPASGASIMLLLFGMIGYPVWFFVLLFTVSGLSRVVGDHIMLGEPITFRKCFSAARKRFGDIFLMGLLSLVALVVLYFIFVFIVLIAVLLMGLLAGAISAARMPPWVAGTVITIISLIIIAAGIFIILYVLARIIFMPQIVMIEGYKTGHAIGRAMKLGAGNWHRIGAIGLFVYFVSLSLLSAFLVPFSIILYFLGILSAEFFLGPTWNVISTSFSQISNLLVLPLWVISFTLLYFDNRVRKEGYDLELLAREVSPGFYWQPNQPVAPASFQYPPRIVMQTGPLGLAGYGGMPREPVLTQVADSALPDEQGSEASGGFEQTSALPISEGNGSASPSPVNNDDGESVQATMPLSSDLTAGTSNMDSYTPPATTQFEVKTCAVCGRELPPRAHFCIHCGATVKE